MKTYVSYFSYRPKNYTQNDFLKLTYGPKTMCSYFQVFQDSFDTSFLELMQGGALRVYLPKGSKSDEEVFDEIRKSFDLPKDKIIHNRAICFYKNIVEMWFHVNTEYEQVKILRNHNIFIGRNVVVPDLVWAKIKNRTVYVHDNVLP